jgi:hypothetical protein
MACFGNAFHKITITAKARFGTRNHLSEMPTIQTSSGLPSRVNESILLTYHGSRRMISKTVANMVRAEPLASTGPRVAGLEAALNSGLWLPTLRPAKDGAPSLPPALRAVFLLPRHPPNNTCRLITGRGRCDAGIFAAVRSYEDAERWSIKDRHRARTIRSDRIHKGENAILKGNGAADPDRHGGRSGTVSIKDINSRVTSRRRACYPECGGK